jgi:UDP-N-acetylglucosamine 2-epimerase (non-hydrolysing)
MKIASVVGARPNFVKLAALRAALGRRPGVRLVTVHTGQHRDPALSEAFFADLDLDQPEVRLEIAPAAPLARLAAMLAALEPALRAQEPDLVMVMGDVDSTLAGALAASRLGIRLAHVEAGLRSFDPTMPEEVNRRLTDALADDLFVSEESGVRNLAREGVPAERVHLVGNVMIDTLLRFRDRSARSSVLERLGLASGGYAVLTLHRPATVDRPERLGPLLRALAALAADLPIAFPVHPRTRPRLPAGCETDGLRLLDPLGYLDFIRLISGARLVLTDSGGVQEETTMLAVPCLTLRDRTERPATVEEGTNRVVGTRPEAVLEACRETLRAGPPAPRRPGLWDGRAAERVAGVLVDMASRRE